jgi:5,10-methylene-tetrahydrofolate dehydrogenase/methenyl tetrahydrofolate cyclohydrolase
VDRPEFAARWVGPIGNVELRHCAIESVACRWLKNDRAASTAWLTAIGAPRFVKADMVREGAVVIDVGINRVEDKTAEKGYRLVGDVDFDAVAAKASLITPVPGGVGPMTIAMLMHNTVRAAKMRHGIV